MIRFVKDLFRHYLNSGTFEKGAALSYYVAFSFLPMIVIVISLLGIIFNESTVTGELFKQLGMYIGDQAALQFESLIMNQHLNQGNVLSTLVGIATLALASTGGLNQLQKSFNAIWGIKVKPKSSVLSYIIKHLVFFLILIILGFTLILSASLSKFLYTYSDRLPDLFANAHLYENLVSFILVTLTFVVLFRSLGNVKVPWKTALVSAGFTSVLFFFGKEAISLYIAQSHLSTTFGAASIIALLMIWVYYTSQILYLGACFAYVFGKRFRCEIVPTEQAVRIIEKELPSSAPR